MYGIIWEGEWKDGVEYNGTGVSIYLDEEGSEWFYKGELKDGKPVDGEGYLEMIENSFRGIFKDGKKVKGILVEKGKEFIVYFENGIEIKQKRMRTFQGVRLMITGAEHVGKTSFNNALRGVAQKKGIKKEEEITHGFEIFPWENKKENTLFSIWDFAGKHFFSFLTLQLFKFLFYFFILFLYFIFILF